MKGMPSAVTQLLAATNDDTLREAVATAGGFHRALHALSDRGIECQRDRDLEGIAAVIEICDRIEVLARCARP
jgi:hypothetical protein